MFWGLILEPHKRYNQVVEKPFHISQAAMDITTGDNEPCQIMVVVDGKNFLVCTLQKGKAIQLPLDLYFKTGESISFLTNGKCNIHITGYMDPEFDYDEEESEDKEEGAGVPARVPAKKRKLNDVTANKKAKAKKKGKKPAPAAVSDDDSIKVNTSGGSDSYFSDEDEDDDDDEEEKEIRKKKKKAAAEVDSTPDTSKEHAVLVSKLSKSQQGQLKNKQQQQAKQQANGAPAQLNGVKKAEKEERRAEAEKKIAGGVVIKDLKVGSGLLAKAGKVVMVYYEGRLKQNNKMFDNCVNGSGFKFRLGSNKKVLSGLDVGIAGMKVGGKRRIVCPPEMAYGAKGSPPSVPPNSTLEFEVELKNVK